MYEATFYLAAVRVDLPIFAAGNDIYYSWTLDDGIATAHDPNSRPFVVTINNGIGGAELLRAVSKDGKDIYFSMRNLLNEGNSFFYVRVVIIATGVSAQTPAMTVTVYHGKTLVSRPHGTQKIYYYPEGYGASVMMPDTAGWANVGGIWGATAPCAIVAAYGQDANETILVRGAGINSVTSILWSRDGTWYEYIEASTAYPGYFLWKNADDEKIFTAYRSPVVGTQVYVEMDTLYPRGRVRAIDTDTADVPQGDAWSDGDSQRELAISVRRIPCTGKRQMVLRYLNLDGVTCHLPVSVVSREIVNANVMGLRSNRTYFVNERQVYRPAERLTLLCDCNEDGLNVSDVFLSPYVQLNGYDDGTGVLSFNTWHWVRGVVDADSNVDNFDNSDVLIPIVLNDNEANLTK